MGNVKNFLRCTRLLINYAGNPSTDEPQMTEQIGLLQNPSSPVLTSTKQQRMLRNITSLSVMVKSKYAVQKHFSRTSHKRVTTRTQNTLKSVCQLTFLDSVPACTTTTITNNMPRIKMTIMSTGALSVPVSYSRGCVKVGIYES